MAPSPMEATPALQEQPAAELLSSQQSCLLPGGSSFSFDTRSVPDIMHDACLSIALQAAQWRPET